MDPGTANGTITPVTKKRPAFAPDPGCTGSNGSEPVPVEVIAFGLEATQAAIEALGANAQLRLSAAHDPPAPFVTDSGNRILDCSFGPIADPARLEERIGRIVGVVDSGLFINRAGPVFVADSAGVHRLDIPGASAAIRQGAQTQGRIDP